MKTNELSSAIEKWRKQLIEEELAENSIKVYITALSQLKEFLEVNSYEDLTISALLRYKDLLLKKRQSGEIKVTTVNAKILGIDRFLSDVNTGLGKFKLKTERVQQKFLVEDRLTSEDLTKLINKALELGDLRDALIMKTLAKTGIRIGELVFFTVEAIKVALETQYISIINKKKERIVLVPKDLSEELLEYANESRISSGIIFPNRKGTDITDRGHMTRRFRKIAEQCDVDPRYCNPQNFRKLFAVTYLESTNDLIGLSDILGHSNLATTRIYLHKSIHESSQLVSSLFSNV